MIKHLFLFYLFGVFISLIWSSIIFYNYHKKFPSLSSNFLIFLFSIIISGLTSWYCIYRCIIVYYKKHIKNSEV